ncbi:hypothetical protein ACW9HW_01930 [Pseudomonas sp. SDO5532_S415]
MPYAIKVDGSFRAIDPYMELQEGETYYEDVPQWVYEKMEADRIKREQTVIEDQWRADELALIADQLIALEDADPSALPVTETEWRAHRTKVRAWKEDAEHFPEAEYRPVRPS